VEKSLHGTHRTPSATHTQTPSTMLTRAAHLLRNIKAGCRLQIDVQWNHNWRLQRRPAHFRMRRIRTRRTIGSWSFRYSCLVVEWWYSICVHAGAYITRPLGSSPGSTWHSLPLQKPLYLGSSCIDLLLRNCLALERPTRAKKAQQTANFLSEKLNCFRIF
jgi:hypothetical protein